MFKETSFTTISVLDSLRAFASLAVCLFHFVCTTTGYITTPWILDVFSVGQYGVQLFFVISGFIIPWAMYHAGFKFQNFFTFLIKRLIRLEPPYVFSIIMALSILFLRENVFGLQNHHTISIKQVFLHFGYLIPFFKEYHWLNQVYWTLAIEFQYYFFIALLFIPLLKANFVYRLLIYTSIIFVSFIGTSAFLLYWLPAFLLGILLFLTMSKLISKKEYYISTLCVVCFCFFKYPIPSVIFSIIPLVFILWFKDLKVYGLNSVGKFSYSVYLIHPLIGSSFINIMSHHFNSSLSKIIIILTGLILTIAGAYIMYFFIEKPSKTFSMKLKYDK